DEAYKGRITSMKLLLAIGSDVNVYPPGRDPAIVTAAGNGQTKAVAFLLERGADINARTKFGWTGLMSAANEGHLGTVELLLSKGADVNTVGDGGSALHMAVQEGHTNIVNNLKQYGAKDCREH